MSHIPPPIQFAQQKQLKTYIRALNAQKISHLVCLGVFSDAAKSTHKHRNTHTHTIQRFITCTPNHFQQTDAAAASSSIVEYILNFHSECRREGHHHHHRHNNAQKAQQWRIYMYSISTTPHASAPISYANTLNFYAHTHRTLLFTPIHTRTHGSRREKDHNTFEIELQPPRNIYCIPKPDRR